MENLVFVQPIRLVFILLVLSPSFCRISSKDASLVERVCKRTMYPDLCVSSLRSNPHSAGADVKGLARIMLELFRDKATDNLVQVKKLQKMATDPVIQRCLNVCLIEYGLANDTYILAAFKYFESNLMADALTNTGWAYDGVETCEENFGEEHRSSLLTARNNHAMHISHIAEDIMSILAEKSF
ncbi:hypothetical protein RJ639_002489 [Escallonia herrerae]|uniref:Pectinesterase inhibitor domain-containing protein n=1 Tax=Escallonia herrerae TaxID=1293975 RepID=A0AA89BTH5_9ASTE|nr:hypothetical protein RJ639_002489 [Escallonia herrerae]